MNAYYAPLEDMRFVLRHLVDVEKLAHLPDAEVLGDPELTDAILEQAGRFASEVLWPLDRVAAAFALNEHYADGVGKMVIV